MTDASAAEKTANKGGGQRPTVSTVARTRALRVAALVTLVGLGGLLLRAFELQVVDAQRGSTPKPLVSAVQSPLAVSASPAVGASPAAGSAGKLP